jgi:hypothetical protein
MDRMYKAIDFGLWKMGSVKYNLERRETQDFLIPI